METVTPMDNSTTDSTDGTLVNSDVKRYLIFQTICMSLVVIVGVPGNCLILRVYHAKPLQATTHFFIMALAWSDLLACLLSVVTFASLVLDQIGSQMPPVISHAVTYIRAICFLTSIFITVMIAIDRFDCVCRPHRRLLNHRRTKIAVLCSFAVSVIMSAPYTFGFIYPANAVISKIDMAFQSFNFLLALTTISFCYGKVYQKIRHHVKVGTVNNSGLTTRSHPAEISGRTSSTEGIAGYNMSAPGVLQTGQVASRRSPGNTASDCLETEPSHRVPDQLAGSTNSAKLQRKTTRMLLVTSLIFMLTWLPYWVFMAVNIAAISGKKINPIVFEVFQYVIFTLYVNNIVNPFIYGLANSRFRRDCQDVIRKMKPC